MGRLEFIEGLRRALNGNVSPASVMDHVNYYNEYISTEIRKGRSEEEVLASLGDPRLIARTIIETNTLEDGGSAYQNGEYGQGYGEYRQAEGQAAEDDYQRSGWGYDQTGGQSYQNAGGYYQDHSGQTFHSWGGRQFRIPGWVWLVVLILAVILVISLVFSVLSFLAPVIIPFILVVFLIKLFRDWLK